MVFSLVADRPVVFEGGSLLVDFSTELYPAGTTFSYQITGLSPPAIAGGLMVGQAVLDSTGKARINVNFAANGTSDPAKTLKLQITGIDAGGAEALTSTALQFQQKMGIQGLSVAVALGERLVYAKGFGLADPATGEQVSPDSLFRLASVSKPITSTVIMDLVETGRLSLDAKAIPLLGLSLTPKDARIYDITIRNLLEMTGGWDRDISGDIAFAYSDIYRNLKITGELTRQDVINNGLNFATLDFAPGTRYAYSNLGYIILAEIIENITGVSYEKATQDLLRLAGIKDMRIGGDGLADRAPMEVTYLSALNNPAYDNFSMAAMDGTGGWIASAVDLMKFATAVDNDTSRPNILNQSTFQILDDKPAFNSSGEVWYGKGWQVDNIGNLFHSGSLPGSSTIIVQYVSGWKLAVLASTNPGPAFYNEVYQTFGSQLTQSWSWANAAPDMFKLFDLPLERRTISLSLRDVPVGYKLVEGDQRGEILQGDGLSQFFYGGGGNDTIVGRAGHDIAVYTGKRADYTVTRNVDGSHSVMDGVAGRDGLDMLTNIEQIRFADQIFEVSSSLAFDAFIAANVSQAKAIAAAYQTLLGGVPSKAGLDFLIKSNLATHFGADIGPIFNDENIYINVTNALVQGNAAASSRFNELASGRTLSEKVASLYAKVIPTSKQSPEGVAFLTRPDGLKFYQDVAIERGITSENGPAVIALAALLKVAVDNRMGIGNPVDDFLRSIADGSTELPASSASVLPIETVDGTKFDTDDLADSLLGAGGAAPAILLVGGSGDLEWELGL